MHSTSGRPIPRHSRRSEGGTRKSHEPDRRRATAVSYVIVGLLALVVIRLGHIQIVAAGHILDDIAPQVEPGPRSYIARPGRIMATDHEILAESLTTFSLVADPVRMRARKESLKGVAQRLAEILGVPRQKLHSRLVNNRYSRHVVLQRWLDTAAVDRIRAEKITGISLPSHYRRHYPHGRTASHVVGGRNKFHVPLFGVEHRYRLLLDGKKAAKISLTGHAGQPMAGREQEALPAVPGRDIVLTLDLDLQNYVEAALDAMVERSHPDKAYVVVVDPNNGDVLAMASRPACNPELLASGEKSVEGSTSLTDAMRLCAVADRVDPGSTFKVLLAAAALDNGVVDLEDTFQCNGQFEAGGQPINCWGRYGIRGHGTVNLEKMVAMSCNVTAAKIALKLGATRFVSFLKAAGIGSQPQSGLPGESAGRLRHAENMPRRDLASLGFGQGLSASPLQITAAIATLANQGRRVSPQVIKAVLNRDGSTFWEPQPTPEPQVCSPETARVVLDMMVSAVENGTAGVAAIDGVKVAAKTGTAQIWDSRRQEYSADEYITSFVLICPADDPQYVIYVAADNPSVGEHGSEVAGPTARDIAGFALR